MSSRFALPFVFVDTDGVIVPPVPLKSLGLQVGSSIACLEGTSS